MSKVGVIGGGPSGLMAAIEAAKNPENEVFVLERNNRCCKKLLLTGNERCNITTTLPINEMIDNYYGNGKFLYSAYYQFSNYDLVQFFEKNGLNTKVEDLKVFPETDLANDVRKVLLKCADTKNVIIKNNLLIKEVNFSHKEKNFLVNEEFYDYLVIATGGITYKSTGSDGIGYRLARSLNHNVIEPQPTLGAIKTEVFEHLQGLTIDVSKINYLIDGNIVANEYGPVIFTHFGLSGPPILNLSYYVTEKGEKHSVILTLFEESLIREKLIKLIETNSSKIFKNILNILLPKRLVEFLFIDKILDKQAAHLTSEELEETIKKLTYWEIDVYGIYDHDKAMATKGGVSIDNIDPKTMMSKIVDNLYFTGELIDIVGKTGGFNLQLAFSTGFVAGKSIAKRR
jgi:predicted Rossmann fold flavoprotein